MVAATPAFQICPNDELEPQSGFFAVLFPNTYSRKDSTVVAPFRHNKVLIKRKEKARARVRPHVPRANKLYGSSCCAQRVFANSAGKRSSGKRACVGHANVSGGVAAYK